MGDDLLIAMTPNEEDKKEFEAKGFEISLFDEIYKYLGVNVNYI